MSNKQTRIKKMVATLAVIMIGICFTAIPLSAVAATDDDEPTVVLRFPVTSRYIISNAEGETLNFNQADDITGDMYIYDSFGLLGSKMEILEVKASTFFTIENRDETETYLYIQNGDYDLIVIKSNGEKSITISIEDGIPKAIVDGNNAVFSVEMYLQNAEDHNVIISGKTNSACSVSDTKEGVLVDGIDGRFTFVDEHSRKSNHYELFNLGGPVLVSNFGGKAIKVSGAVVLNLKWYSGVQVLHVRKMDDPNALLLYWGKVKGAKGYVVYRYDSETQEYRKVATLKGRSNRTWVDRFASEGEAYRYKVAYYTLKKSGKMNVGKMSYNVTGITQHETLENVYKITVDKTELLGKVGKTAKLTATLMTAQDKTVLSSSVRWHSMDKKIATVDRNGNVTFKKNGTCYIFAKAHDGMNSNKVKVVVKK